MLIDALGAVSTNLGEQRPPFIGDVFVIIDVEEDGLKILGTALLRFVAARYSPHALICNRTEDKEGDHRGIMHSVRSTSDDEFDKLSSCCFSEIGETDDTMVLLFPAGQVTDIQGTQTAQSFQARGVLPRLSAGAVLSTTLHHSPCYPTPGQCQVRLGFDMS